MSNLVWLVVIVVLVGFVALSYNSLVQRRNQVKNAWSQIDVQLKRRIELIPNLVETVKGYADFEQKTLQQVIAARNVAMAAPSTVAEQAGADNALSGALRQLFALSESYPDLKANASFLSLQEELSNTESRIAYARQFYGDAVLSYNSAIQKFPGFIIARVFKFAKREYFEAEDAARDTPQVKF
jgi:LemA protein